MKREKKCGRDNKKDEKLDKIYFFFKKRKYMMCVCGGGSKNTKE